VSSIKLVIDNIYFEFNKKKNEINLNSSLDSWSSTHFHEPRLSVFLDNFLSHSHMFIRLTTGNRSMFPTR